eukprot:12256864-Ditylum_brightwellii.AAC.1
MQYHLRYLATPSELSSDKLRKAGVTPSENDLCLFFTDKILCLVHIDNYLFLVAHQKEIDNFHNKIKDKWVVFNIENIATPSWTPSELSPLGKDPDGKK